VGNDYSAKHIASRCNQISEQKATIMKKKEIYKKKKEGESEQEREREREREKHRPIDRWQ